LNFLSKPLINPKQDQKSKQHAKRVS